MSSVILDFCDKAMLWRDWRLKINGFGDSVKQDFLGALWIANSCVQCNSFEVLEFLHVTHWMVSLPLVMYLLLCILHVPGMYSSPWDVLSSVIYWKGIGPKAWRSGFEFLNKYVTLVLLNIKPQFPNQEK